MKINYSRIKFHEKLKQFSILLRGVERLGRGVDVYSFFVGGRGIKKPSASKCGGLIRMNMAATYSPGWNTSTIGHKGLNFSVRYGKR